jgi:histone H3
MSLTASGQGSRKKKSRFFETYISKLLKTDENSSIKGITGNAKQQLNSVICHLARSLTRTIITLTEISQKKTVSEREVTNAIRIKLPSTLGTESIKRADVATSLYHNCDTSGRSRQDKAGIIFPPSVTEKFLRGFGFSKVMITNCSPLILAVALETIAMRIINDAREYAIISKRSRITIRDLELGTRSDPDLRLLFSANNLSYLGGGVIPFLHASLIARPTKRKKKASTEGQAIKKPHRFRPGTVAIREIRRFQRLSNCLTFPKHPFEKLIRNMIPINTNDEKSKISKGVFIVLQYFIEQYLVDVLRGANRIAIHCGRVKLMGSDIQIMMSLNDETAVTDITNQTQDETTKIIEADLNGSTETKSFEEVDLNGDGVITRAEWDSAMK